MALRYVFASGKGGVGKSSAAAGISRALCARGCKVLLCDFDIGLRSLDLMLGLSETVVFDWGDIIAGRCAYEDAVLTDGNLSFLAAPRSFEDSFTPDSVRAFICDVQDAFDYVIFDAPAGIGRGFELASAAADTACLVTTPDSVCARSCAVAASLLRESGKSNIRLIINRFEEKPVTKKKLLNIDDCIDAVAVRLLGIIPEDETIVYSSVTGKNPDRRSPSFSAFGRIAGRMLGERIPLFD